MSEETQTNTIAFLAQPSSYCIDGKVDVIETHISRVFLAGEYVYKLKRAVKLPYVDFISLAARKHACEQELTLNRRTAPDIYLDALAITKDSTGALHLGGDGEAVDWVVKMRRFDQDQLLDALARIPGALTRAQMEDLSESLFAFHAAAEIVRTQGGHAAMAAIARANAEALDKFGAEKYDKTEMTRLTDLTMLRLAAVAELLDRRRDDGHVRRGHGDLHLRNIVLLKGRPTPFDCIEFNEDFAIVDTMYDLAFLLMDLEHRDLRELANAVLNRTIDLSDDIDALACLPLFLSLRAAVRAHVDAAQKKFGEGAEYLDLALDFLTPRAPRLIAVGGLSGSGKSSLARRIAPAIGGAPGAVVLRSDVIRKRLAGVGLYDKLDAASYTQEMSGRVYTRMLDEARRAIAAGHCAILDAVYAGPGERDAARALAGEFDVPFDGLWLEVPLSVRQHRIGRRRKDASDATEEVARAQDRYDLGLIDWHILDATADLGSLERQAAQIL